MDWKQSFNPAILKEGYSLYIHQCCGPIQTRGDFYEGFIADPAKSSHYFVRAELKDNEITSIRCSCSLGKSENLCLHEAAFLFDLEKRLSDSSLSQVVSSNEPSFNSWLEENAFPTTSKSLFSSYIPSQKSPLKTNVLSSQEVNELEQAIQYLRGKVSSPHEPYFKPSSLAENPLTSLSQNKEKKIFQSERKSQDDSNRCGLSSSQETAKENFPLGISSQDLEELKEGIAHLTHSSTTPRNAHSFFQSIPSHNAQPQEKRSTSVAAPSTSLKNLQKQQAHSERKEDHTSSKSKMGLQGLIASLSRKELENLVLKEALSHLDFRLRLELELLKDIPDDLLTLYCAWLDEVIYETKQNSKENLSLLADPTYGYLKEKVELLLNHHQIEMAFSLISYAISTFEQAHFVLNQEIERKLVSWLSTILDQANSSLEGEIFAWLEIKLETPPQDFQLHQALLTILSTFFNQEQYLVSKFERLKAEFLIHEVKSTKEDKQTLERIIESLDALCEPNPDLCENDPSFKVRLESKPYFWKLQMDKAYEKQNYQSARMVCQRLIRLYPKNSFLQAQQIRHLISLLSLEGKEDQAIQTLIDFITQNPHIQPEDLILLSQKVDEETYLGALVSLKTKVAPFILAEAYFEKGRKEELMRCIEENQDLLLAQQYEKALKDEYASRLAALWKEEAFQKANTKNPANYQEVALALRKIAVLPGQYQFAKDLAKSIHESHPHKSALFHRLQETGLLEDI